MKKTRSLGCLTALLMIAGMLTAAPFTAVASEIPQGFSVEDLELGDLTVEVAKKAVEDYVDGLSKQTITLDVKGNASVTSAEELGFTWNNSPEVEDAIDQIASGNLIARYMRIKDLEKEPVMISLETSMDEAKIVSFVEEHCGSLEDEPKNASIVREDGQFVITPGVSGKIVDLEATAEAVEAALLKGLAEPVKAVAVVAEKDPDIKESDLVTIQDVLGTFSTDFSSSGSARSKNLQAGASKINGHLIMPGETLSGYECMQPFTTANGYYTAAAYENGQVVDSVGGGVCQIATTLYNTALMAELEIAQRQNHSMIVTYVKPSQDAAIAGTYKDIKITNNYSTPIYVEGGTEGRTLTFTIYGKDTRPANREIKYVSEVLGSTNPGEPTTRVDNSLAPGARRQVQSAHWGMRSRLWKYVYLDGVETERTILHTDSYMASKAVVLVGPEIAEVPAATENIQEVPSEPTETQVPAPAEGVNGGPGISQTAPAQTAAAEAPAAEAPAAEAPAAEAPVEASGEAPGGE